MSAANMASATRAPGVDLGPAPRGLVVFNDLHLADHPPAGRKDGYREEGLAMLEECVKLANDNQCVLATTGDLYHIKRPDRISHALNGDIADILSELHYGPLIVVPGNHDMGPLGLISVGSTQPMRGLIKAGVVDLLVDGEPRYLPQYLIVSRPYDMKRDTDPSYYALTKHEWEMRGDRQVVMLAHGSIIPDDEERPYPTITTSEINSEGIDYLFSGHIHEDLGFALLREDGGCFVNRGALSRCSRTLANRTRTIQVVLLTPLEARTKALISALPSEEIFIEDTLELKGNDAITEFVKDLTEGVVFEGIGDVQAMLAQVEVNEEVRREVLRLLEENGL